MAGQRVVLVGGGADQSLERLWLERALGAQYELVEADAPSAERIAQLLDASDASVVLLHADARELHARVELLGQLLGLKPNVWVVVVGDQDDKRVILSLIRAGARDFVTVGSDGAELRAALERSRKTSPAEAARGEEQIVALLCARPELATSTFAVHLALAIVEAEDDSERRTLLVDIGLPAADSLVYLDLKPSYSFVDAARSVRRFDETLIETAFARHASGLSILPRPDDPAAMRELSPSDAVALLSTLRQYFSHVLVNLAGVRVNQFLLQMLQLADRKFLVADQSVLSCGAARRLVEALEGHGVAASEVGLVVDRYTKRLSPSAARIAEMLGLPLTATLPPNGILKVEAMNSGTSIFEIAPRCPYARTVRSFARGLLDMGPGPASGSSSSGWARWLRAGSR